MILSVNMELLSIKICPSEQINIPANDGTYDFVISKIGKNDTYLMQRIKEMMRVTAEKGSIFIDADWVCIQSLGATLEKFGIEFDPDRIQRRQNVNILIEKG